MRPPSPDTIPNSFRYALLALVFCAVTAVELLHAKFALLTLSELHAYWLGSSGRIPFSLLPWSERHFGGDALAMRLPLLAVFALLLAVALFAINRLILRRLSPMVLTVGVVVALFALGVQRFFALKTLRAERHALFGLTHRVERAAAPGEEIVAEETLLLPLYAYGTEGLRQQLRSEQMPDEGMPPAVAFSESMPASELIFVGAPDDPFARKLAGAGYTFREEQTPQEDESELVAQYYRAAGAGIYFVSPPAAATSGGAVSSKP